MKIRDLINIVEAAQRDTIADYDQWSPERGIDDFVKTEFTTGGCAALAVALAEKTGWAVAADFLGDELEHAWCLNRAEKAVDINGVHTGKIAVTKYGRENGVKTKRIKLDALRADIQDKGMLEWARQIVELFPEHFGIKAITEEEDFEDEDGEPHTPVRFNGETTLSSGEVVRFKAEGVLDQFDDADIKIDAFVNGEWVAHAHYEDGVMNHVQVISNFRRRGIASALYDFMEKNYYPVKPSGSLTPDGSALWKSRGRDIEPNADPFD